MTSKIIWMPTDPKVDVEPEMTAARVLLTPALTTALDNPGSAWTVESEQQTSGQIWTTMTP